MAAAERYGRGDRRPGGPAVVPVMVQRQAFHIPSAGLGASFASFHSPYIVHPFIMEGEAAETVVPALMHNSGLDRMWGILKWLTYFHVSLMCDSAAYNYRGARIISAELRRRFQEAGLLNLILLLAVQRCDGHQMHIIVRNVIVLADLMPSMFSLAHLIRHGGYRGTLMKAIRRILEDNVVVRSGPPPNCCRRFLLELFRRTLLRGCWR